MNFLSVKLCTQHAARGVHSIAALALTVLLAACSGHADPPQPLENITPTPSPVVTAPSVTPVADQTVQVGQTATFTESAAGTPPLAYQWQKNGTAIDGATAANYTTPATVAGDDGSMFIVVVSNSAGSATTAPAKLTVTVPVTLTITQSPADVTVAAGASATFTAAATCSAGTITWQWQRSNDGGSTFTTIALATVATYTLVTTATDNAAVFRAQASCAGLTRLSNTAALTVTPVAPPASGLNLKELTTSLALGAELHDPAGIVFDAAGIGYFVDSGSNQIRRLAADGSVTSIAGAALSYDAPGGTDGTGTAASFNHPRGIAIATDGTLYVTDSLNHTIRKVTAAGVVTTLAGTVGAAGSTDGTGAAARFNTPFGISFGSDGNLYVADSENFTVRQVTPAGVVTTIAGLAGTAGTADGVGSVTRFGLPSGIVGDSAGNLYVSDTENNVIRRLTLAGVTATIVGNGSLDPADAVGTLAGIPRPAGVALAGSSLYVTANGPSGSNQNHGQIRRIDLTDLSAHTVSGQAQITPAEVANIDGLPATAEFYFDPYVSGSPDDVNRSGLAIAASGAIYVTANNRIRVVDNAGITTSLTGADQNLESNGDGVALAGAQFRGNLSFGLASNGDLLVADPGASVIRRVTTTGAVSLVSGLYDSNVLVDVDGTGSAAQFAGLSAVVGLPDGTVRVSEALGSVIRKIAVDGTVSTFAGVPGDQGTTDGPVGTGLFDNIFAMVRDPASGALYVADYGGQVIRRVDTDGSITTIAGAPNSSNTEPDGTGSAALFVNITGLAIDSSGIVYAADEGGHTIRKITPAGVVTTLVGGQTSAGFVLPNVYPNHLVVDSNGTVYFTDADNGTVSTVSPTGVITLLLNGNPGLNGTVTGSMPSISSPTGILQLSAKSFAISSIKLYGPGGTDTVPYPSIYILTLP